MEYQRLDRFALPPGFRGRPAWLVQAWWLVESLLFRLSPQPLHGWRRFLLRAFGARIGHGVVLQPTVRTVYPWKLRVGDRSWIGDDVALYSLAPITIGSDSVISQRSYLCGGKHDSINVTFDTVAEPITIGDQVWVAADVFVGQGVTIGDGAVVGARSTVLSDLPAGMICFGPPAVAVKPRPTPPPGTTG
jgi:putative colanic acid biosynthesis acetyltransferase WcaF